MKKIVIFTQNRNFFGAQIVLIPLLERLKTTYPDSRIHLFAKNSGPRLLQNAPGLVDEIIEERGRVSTLRRYLAIAPHITLNLRQKSLFTTVLMALAGKGDRRGYRNGLSRWSYTQSVDYDASIYRALNYLRLHDNSSITGIGKGANYSRQGNSILIMPGAGSKHKIWRIDNYLALADKLHRTYPGLAVTFVIGKKEQAYHDKIYAHGFEVINNAPLKELFSHASEAALTIANDCGPSHIAQVTGCPTIILYSDEKNNADRVIAEWFNKRPGSYAIKGENREPIDTITVDTVFATAVIALTTEATHHAPLENLARTPYTNAGHRYTMVETRDSAVLPDGHPFNTPQTCPQD